MKRLLKFLASQVDVDIYERLMMHPILKNEFKDIASVPTFESREDLWDECIARQVGSKTKITYVEFGVHEGYSLKYFSQKNLNKDSTFIGLDSFEGLPENWGYVPKGTFDTKGNMPDIKDGRVSFIKGWFQNTWDELYAQLSTTESLVVHYDADLYSSTLFALSKIDILKKTYIAIFDEFTGHEIRALYNYLQAYNASASFIGKTIDSGFACQVMCKIVPNNIRMPTPSEL